MASSIIVFSQLRWDLALQRAQPLLSRLASHHQIVFFEEPVHIEGEAFLHRYSPLPNVLVCQPHTPAPQPGFHDEQWPYLRSQLRGVVAEHPDHLAWFSTPMAFPLLRVLKPALVVYDAADDPIINNASNQFLACENALLKAADLVFAGSPALYRALHERHLRVHWLPGGVDTIHFAQALDRANSHPLHRHIPGPRMGYYGVIDERFDAALIDAVAAAHPQWQVVLVGPVVRIDVAALPRRENIHYLGAQPYEALPRFLAGWDVCLLPLVAEATLDCSASLKLLEYMAAELPIVSTALADVHASYGDVVAVAEDAPRFIQACEAALLASREERLAMLEAMRSVVAANSWDATAARVRELVRSAARRSYARATFEEDAHSLPTKLSAELGAEFTAELGAEFTTELTDLSRQRRHRATTVSGMRSVETAAGAAGLTAVEAGAAAPVLKRLGVAD